MNQKSTEIRLIEFMQDPQGWGRDEGRVVYQKLLDYVESHPGNLIFKISLAGVKRIDISFASETIVELARRYRMKKGFCFIDLFDRDMLENWEAAAERKNQPIMIWTTEEPSVIGVKPTQGNLAAFQFALQRPITRAAEFSAATEGMSIANASSKFKQLWEQGFLLRREDTAGSGGIEFSYSRIG